MGELATRRANLFKALPENSIALIFSGVSKIASEDSFLPFLANRNFFYLTGIEQENSTLMLIKVPGEEKAYLFVDEHNELKERWTGKRLTFEEASQISELDNVYSNSTYESMLQMALNSENNVYGRITNLFIDLSNEIKIKENCSTQIYAKELVEKNPSLKLENIYPLIVELRLVKSDLEIRELEEAINVTNTAINDLLVNMHTGMQEHELSDRFEYYGKTHGRHPLSFETIIGSGVNSTTLHHPVSQQVKTISSGDVVLFDLGLRYNGYCADISRTYPVNGTFNEFQRKVYEVVLACNKAVINYIKPGLSIPELQEFTISFLQREGMKAGLFSDPEDVKKYYIHNVSHFLGLDTHDVGDRKKPLVPGNVITVEPGLYFVDKEVGVRIEDDVVVTENGCRCLSRGIKKELDEIEKMLRSIK